MAALFVGCAGPSWVSIDQGGRTFVPSSDFTVRAALDARPFSIHALIKPYDEPGKRFYGIKVLAGTLASVQFLAHIGDKTDSDGPFGPGMGMAVDPASRTLYLGEGGFNYLYYADGSAEAQSLKLVSTKGEYREVLATFIGLALEGKTEPVESWGGKELFLLLYYDADLDDTIDPGELVRARLRFRKG
ncbi:MAG: hypothetical protein WCQ50_04450 [Spirochaetota bacterium]